MEIMTMADDNEDQRVTRIVEAVCKALVELRIEHRCSDQLNALTHVMVGLVMENESLSKSEAYLRMASVFTEHATVLAAKEVEELPATNRH